MHKGDIQGYIYTMVNVNTFQVRSVLISNLNVSCYLQFEIIYNTRMLEMQFTHENTVK